MNADDRIIYERILDVARRKETVFYSQIAPLVGLNMAILRDRTEMGHILDRISEAEHRAGRPLLSAVVILKCENIPGDGFFDLARHLRLHQRGADDLRYFVEELRRVHCYWSEH